MIPEAIWSACIVGVCSIVVQLLINRSNRMKEHEEQMVYRARLEGQLKSIDNRLIEHNQYAEKLGSLRDSMLLIQQDVKYIKEGKL